MQHISNHGSAESLAKELEMVCIDISLVANDQTLDEEAEIFVKKMWRMSVTQILFFEPNLLTCSRLILETESKKRKIPT